MYDGGKKTSNFKYKIKRLNDLNSKFMKDILQKTRWLTRNLSNIKVHFHNTVGYDDNPSQPLIHGFGTLHQKLTFRI